MGSFLFNNENTQGLLDLGDLSNAIFYLTEGLVFCSRCTLMPLDFSCDVHMVGFKFDINNMNP